MTTSQGTWFKIREILS